MASCRVGTRLCRVVEYGEVKLRVEEGKQRGERDREEGGLGIGEGEMGRRKEKREMKEKWDKKE